ncbi:MAG: hydrogenase maturation nickel metallochaperone HypA [Caldilineaceae bacterium]|nr:hydrogenase maturation nickel metallochaperone HypA [Caldilineaceae bacterium]MBP8125835.1 hydrogenase maturation nickel metallochaperone HypA [Caldilineaceae bacterium]
MHELAITQSIIDLAIEAAKREDARAINQIDLVIGDLSSIVDDSVQFYFDILSKETLAAGATLHFRREPAIAHCLDCGAQTPVKPPVAAFCPECDSQRIQIRGGKDFRMESIDIDN